MLIYIAIYTAVSLALLGWLAHAITRVANALADCPDMEAGQRAGLRAAALSISTGFIAIGLGGLMAIGGALAGVNAPHVVALLSALGLGALCLGLGFTHAVTLLRGLMMPAPAKAAHAKGPWDAPANAPASGQAPAQAPA